MGSLFFDCKYDDIFIFCADHGVFEFVDVHVLDDFGAGLEALEGLGGDFPFEDDLGKGRDTIWLGMPVRPPPPPDM